MKRAFLWPLFGLLCGGVGAAPSAPVQVVPSVIPQPLHLQAQVGQPGFSLQEGIKVHHSVSRSELGRAAIRALMAAGVPVLPEETTGELTVERVPNDNKEWYAIQVTPQGISLKVASPQALHGAAQTLAQSMVSDAAGQPALPAMAVEDAPLLPYRGLMLDPCRHPQTVEQTKKMLRLMARYKLNRLHWHLADDQGWRIEITKYPRLTEVGSHRAETPTLANHDVGDATPTKPFFFTQAEIRDVVAYAHSLGIVVIPEIEVPGHSCAAIAAYPELGNSDIPGYAPRVATTWGVLPYTYAPKAETLRFLEDVFAEVCALFPRAEFVHIGGDEAPREQWQQSPFARRFMQQNSMRHAGQIQHWFTHRMAELLHKHGRRIVGWDEMIDDGAVPTDAVVMYWRAWYRPSPLLRALRAGHDVIQSPDSHFYFNFSQGKLPADPRYKPHGNPEAEQDWRHIYAYNPIPANITPEQRRHIIGLQANCWSESIADGPKLEYQCVPRICALAEVAWRAAELRSAEEFLPRLLAQYPWFEQQQINYRREDGSPALSSAGQENVSWWSAELARMGKVQLPMHEEPCPEAETPAQLQQAVDEVWQPLSAALTKLYQAQDTYCRQHAGQGAATALEQLRRQHLAFLERQLPWREAEDDFVEYMNLFAHVSPLPPEVQAALEQGMQGCTPEVTAAFYKAVDIWKAALTATVQQRDKEGLQPVHAAWLEYLEAQSQLYGCARRYNSTGNGIYAAMLHLAACYCYERFLGTLAAHRAREKS